MGDDSGLGLVVPWRTGAPCPSKLGGASRLEDVLIRVGAGLVALEGCSDGGGETEMLGEGGACEDIGRLSRYSSGDAGPKSIVGTAP